MKQLFGIALIILMVSLVFVSSGFSPFTVKAESWQINVSGLVSQQLNITLATLQAMPQTNVSATLFCVSAPKTPLEGGNWQGVKLWTILTQAGISSGATKIAFYASDGFTTDLTVDVAQDPSIIVAYTLNGTPLGQGELTRLVVPGHYGYKWIDQIISIVAVNYDYTGTYESEGYPDDGLFTSTNLPSFPTPNIPYPPSVTPTPINSPTTTHLQSPTTSPTASTATNSSIRPTSSSNVMSGSFEVIMIIVAVLIAAVVFTIVLKRKKVVKKKQHLSLSSTHIIKKELTAQFIV